MIDANFQVCSRVTFIKDSPPVGRPYGSLRIGLEVEACIARGRQIDKHPLFMDIKYNSDDLHKGGFETFRNRVTVGGYLFVSGNLKIRPAKDKWPASISVETSWRNVLVRLEPPRYKNEFVIQGKVAAVAPTLVVTIRRRNPKTNEWIQQDFPIVMDGSPPVRVGDLIVVEGFIVGTNPNDKKSLVWLFGTGVY